MLIMENTFFELYNENFVYKQWDNKLTNAKVLAADNLNNLRDKVNAKEDLITIVNNFNEYEPFRLPGTKPSQNTDDDPNAFRFVYYDPFYRVKVAFLKGRRVQYLNSREHWITLSNEACLNEDFSLYKNDELECLQPVNDKACGTCKNCITKQRLDLANKRIRNAFTVIEDKSKQRRVAKDFYILNIYKTNSEDSQLIAETKKIDILDYEKQYAKLEDEIRKRNYWTEKTLLTDFEYLN